MRLAVQSFCALSADATARRLGITCEIVDERRRVGTLLAISEGSDWWYPACQFRQGEVVPGLTKVIRGLAAAGPWGMLDFLLAPNTVLAGRTPLQALLAGDRNAVLRLVRMGGPHPKGAAPSIVADRDRY